MTNYKCILLDSNGKQVSKTIEADNENALLIKVKQSGMFLLSTQVTSGDYNPNRPLKAKELIMFCRQLSIMMQSGITVTKALSILDEKAQNKKAKKIYGQIYEDLQKGKPLSESMKELKVFPVMLVNMIEAGESSGMLEVNLAKMSDYYEKDNKLRNKMKQAMMYPLILSLVAVVVVIFLVTQVLPTFFTLYEGRELPWPTQIIVGVSDFLLAYWLPVIAILVAVIFIVRALLKIKDIRIIVDDFKLSIPIVGKLNRTIYSSRCARTFASLYSSGMGMIDILNMVSRVIGNAYIEYKFEGAIEEVTSGELISGSLSDMNVFDPMFTSMVYVGEESGALDEVLNKAADYFDEEADAASTRLVSLLEPLLLIVMGLVIGFIVIAIMLPMYGMMDAIQ